MSLLEQLSRPECWERFYEYKTSLVSAGAAQRELRDFIDRKDYLPVCEAILRGERWPLPRKVIISKQALGARPGESGVKRRTVYLYPEPENTVLKLLNWLLLRKYDRLFSDGLYSFRPGRSAKDAIRRFVTTPGLDKMWAYKTDISNYFNSVPVDRLLPMLAETLSGDPELLVFLTRLLEEPQVLEHGTPVMEQKGSMAGTPRSAFYANLYLRELDRRAAAAGVPYARYSDDIILFGATRQETETRAAALRTFLGEQGLAINPRKEQFSPPEEGWTFLGFRYRAGEIDIARATVEKLKGKMRRKTRALARWRDRNEKTGEQAARAFLRVFNRKLLESPEGSELSWSHWFFPVLTTAESLHEIDRYAQDCLRVLASGKRTKGRFDVRYDDLKPLGYRSLVHEYYESKPPLG